MQRTKKSALPATVLALIILAGLGTATGIILISNTKSDKPPSDSTAQSQDSSKTVSYNDGSFSATGTYPTQGGRESIEVTISIAGDFIKNASVIQNGITPQAKEYQGYFVSAYKESVIGKKIDEVSLSRVAGSSLTSIGFNKALEQIKTDASK